MNDQNLTAHDTCGHACRTKCMPWSGILAAALVAIGLSFLLSLFGTAIGLSAFETSDTGVTTVAIGGYIGMLIGVVAVMYFSGWVAGYFGRKNCCNRNVGALYGFIAWCLAFVIMVVLATQTMEFVSANLYAVANTDTVTVQVLDSNTSHVVTKPAHATANHNAIVKTNVNNEQAVNTVGVSLFLTFVLFFIGALSSAIGGYCGLKRDDSCCDSDKCGCSKP